MHRVPIRDASPANIETSSATAKATIAGSTLRRGMLKRWPTGDDPDVIVAFPPKNDVGRLQKNFLRADCDGSMCPTAPSATRVLGFELRGGAA